MIKEESEEIDIVDVKYVLTKHRRQKYRCRCGACIETAPGPLKLFSAVSACTAIRGKTVKIASRGRAQFTVHR
jgi:hypothetical protein